MRVITGTARGRKLREPEGMASRPTTDNVKESMFNLIQFDIEGRRVLDLFAGTGQLGIEALSRGARSAVFVDESRAAVQLGRPHPAPRRRCLGRGARHRPSGSLASDHAREGPAGGVGEATHPPLFA